MISEQTIEDYKLALERLELSRQVIIDRVNEVINAIAAAFNKRINWWWFPGAQEGEAGDIGQMITDPFDGDWSEISFVIDKSYKMMTDEWDYSCSFPRRFLFMDHDDIRNEVREQIKVTRENVIKRKQKSDEKKMLRASGLKKLTQGEREALGL